MARKPFNPKLYEEWDRKARQWTRAIMPAQYVVKDNPLKHGVDLLVYENDTHAFNVEPEVKTIWTGRFPYPDLNLPIRKSKFCHLEKPTLFIVFSKDGSEYFAVWDYIVNCCEVQEVPNKYVRRGELFFKIPLVDCCRDIKRALRKHWRRKAS